MLKGFDPTRTRYQLLISLAGKICHLWFSTCRVKIIGRPVYERYVSGDANVVAATWHRGAIFLVWFFGRFHPMIMFSRSRDGELITRMAEQFGVIPTRGSSSRGGRKAWRGMLTFLSGPGHRKAATVADGPRGPRCVAKKGMIVLAKEAGVPLLPIAVSAHPAFTLRKTWDKTLIPLPFSRVTVVFREPWNILKNLGRDELELWRQTVEETLNEMMHQADADTGYRE
jgi:lysophospholipid acyltransferase (LPLAT)-like uncharacterized protein